MNVSLLSVTHLHYKQKRKHIPIKKTNYNKINNTVSTWIITIREIQTGRLQNNVQFSYWMEEVRSVYTRLNSSV